MAILFVAVSLLSACHKDDYGKLSEVVLNVNDFDIVNQNIGSTPISKSEDADTSKIIKSITVAFYAANGTEQYKHTQRRSDTSSFSGTNFGHFRFLLPSGTYTMVVLGYGSDSTIALTSPTVATFSDRRIRDCFAKIETIHVNSTGVNTISAELSRIVSMFSLRSLDQQPEGIDSIRISVNKGSRTFNPTTGLATSDDGASYTASTSSIVGRCLSAPFYLFLTSDVETVDFTYTLYSHGSAVTTRTIPNVELRRNRKTIATGHVYHNSTSAFTLNTIWLSELNITF